MNTIKDTLKKLVDYQQEIDKLYAELYKKAEEIIIWENENLGKAHNIPIGWTCDRIEIEDDIMYFRIYETWGHDYRDETIFSIEIYKLVNDDWKNIELNEHLEFLKKQNTEC